MAPIISWVIELDTCLAMEEKNIINLWLHFGNWKQKKNNCFDKHTITVS